MNCLVLVFIDCDMYAESAVRACVCVPPKYLNRRPAHTLVSTYFRLFCIKKHGGAHAKITINLGIYDSD